MPDELMTFVNLVRNMRNYQKQYFKTRDHNSLLDSRHAESLVDKWIEDFDRRQRCPGLFQEEELPF